MPHTSTYSPPSKSPLAKAGQLLGGLISARSGGTSSSRGGRGRQAPATGLSKLLRGGRR